MTTLLFPRSIMSIEKQANDPLQNLGMQKEPKVVSFDEENLRNNLQGIRESESSMFCKVSPGSDEEESVTEEKETQNDDSSDGDSKGEKEALLGGVSKREDEDEDENGIKTPRQTDILSGRGAGINLHPGNVYFRDLIAQHKSNYLESDPGEKKRIIRRIVQAAQSRGRFLKQDPQSELWICISFDEARKKVGQALRENAPAIKKQCESKETIKKRKVVDDVQDVHSEYLTQASTSSSYFMPRIEMELLSSQNRPSMNHHNFQTRLLSLSQSQQRANHDDTVDGLLWRRVYMIQQEQDLLNKQLERKNDEMRELMDALYRYQMGRLSNSPISPMEMLLQQQQQQQQFPLRTNDNITSDRKLDTNDFYEALQKKRRITIRPGA
jgi:hypothetical protein